LKFADGLGAGDEVFGISSLSCTQIKVSKVSGSHTELLT
jgi:hypothetical protein